MKKPNLFKYVLPLTFAGIILSGCGDNNNPLGGDHTIDTTQTGGQGGGNQQGEPKFENYKKIANATLMYMKDGKEIFLPDKAFLMSHDGKPIHPGDTVVYDVNGVKLFIYNDPIYKPPAEIPACNPRKAIYGIGINGTPAAETSQSIKDAISKGGNICVTMYPKDFDAFCQGK
jgi:hypothetical protein